MNNEKSVDDRRSEGTGIAQVIYLQLYLPGKIILLVDAMSISAYNTIVDTESTLNYREQRGGDHV